jgi:hypothetical protein
MARFLAFLAIIGGFSVAHAQSVNSPTTRVIEGRVTDAQGRPVREGKVMFAPQTPPVPFSEAGTSAIDARGHYRIELSGFPHGSRLLLSTGPVRFLVLAPGFRGGVGKVDAGTGPATVDVRLSAEAWRESEIVLVDRDGKPVVGAELTLQMGGTVTWSREMSDADGRCRLKSAPGQPFEISVRREGYLPTVFNSRATADDPTSFKVPLYPRIQGRVVDPARKPLAGIQIGRLIAPNYDAGLDKPSDYLTMYPLSGSTKPAITDGEGRFSLAPKVRLDTRSGKFRIWPLPVCFADPELRRVFFLRVDLQSSDRPYEITLRPARQVRIALEHEVTTPSGVLESWWELNDLAGATGSDAGVYVMQDLVKRNGTGPDSRGGDWILVYWPEGRVNVREEGQLDAMINDLLKKKPAS